MSRQMARDYEKRGMRVDVRNNDFNSAYKKFKRLVANEGIIKEVRDRQHFEKPSAKKRRAKAQERRRWQKKVTELTGFYGVHHGSAYKTRTD